MIRFDLTVLGERELAQTLYGAAANGHRRVQGATMDWAQGRALPALRRQPYPPTRPNQRYRRTGLLGRSWEAGSEGDLLVIRNTRPGATFVVGDGQGGGQAWMHLGRWWTAESILRREQPELRKGIVRELDYLFALKGGRR